MRIIVNLIVAVLIISWSSILIRWMGEVHPLIITFYRLFFSSIALLPFVFVDLKATLVKSKSIKYHLLLAGFFLSMHFFTWISSLQLTTVGNSIFLESTHPLFGWILSILILKEKASKALLPALLLGILGMYLIIAGDIHGHGNAEAFLGDLLALVSAFCIAAYLIIARILRQELSILPYLFMVYSIAAIFTLVLVFAYGLSLWDLPASAWLFLILLALGPNLIGHSLLNWASRHIPVYRVNMALLSESVLATIYAAILLDEIPHALFYVGALLIIGAIVSVFRVRK